MLHSISSLHWRCSLVECQPPTESGPRVSSSAPSLATQHSYLTQSAPVPGGQEHALHSINCLTHTPTTIPESCKFINNLFLRPSLMASPHIIMLHTLLFGCVYGHAMQCTGSPARISLFSTLQFTFSSHSPARRREMQRRRKWTNGCQKWVRVPSHQQLGFTTGRSNVGLTELCFSSEL